MAEKSRYDYRVEPQDVDFTLRATISSLGAAILNTARIDAEAFAVGVDARRIEDRTPQRRNRRPQCEIHILGLDSVIIM